MIEEDTANNEQEENTDDVSVSEIMKQIVKIYQIEREIKGKKVRH